MRYGNLPLEEALNRLSADERAAFEQLCNQPHLLDMTQEELFAAVYTCFYLLRLLAGAIDFDRTEFRSLVRMDE